ncbi:DDE-type integrase/transposase/recombinase [Actinomadura madurae]|uniref:DDE-type integrase/transposase/recombinase n=1 Tax=Actinomadura madurae TaxID=1993 RepID=UPI003B8A73FC
MDRRCPARPQDRRPLEVLVRFIDDHSRAIVGHRWGYFEDTVRLAAALRPALAARCVPEHIYVDNGSAFVDAALKRAAAKLAIRIIHSAPGQPEGRGKIERFAPGFGERILQVRVTTPGAFERVNPQLRGRRHRRRFQYPAGHRWGTRGVNEQLRDLAPRGLPLLRLDSTRRRDPWHVRVPRRSDGTGGSALTSAQPDWKFF